MSQHHVVRAEPETCHWGFFDAGLKPVLSVASGDTVTIDSVSGGPDVLPEEDRFDILSEHLAIHKALEPRLGAHILTGPIAVEGAEPGDLSLGVLRCRAEAGLVGRLGRHGDRRLRLRRRRRAAARGQIRHSPRPPGDPSWARAASRRAHPDRADSGRGCATRGRARDPDRIEK